MKEIMFPLTLNWFIVNCQCTSPPCWHSPTLFKVQLSLKTPWVSLPRHCLSNRAGLPLESSGFSGRNAFAHGLINDRGWESFWATALHMQGLFFIPSCLQFSSDKTTMKYVTEGAGGKRLNGRVSPTCGVNGGRQLPVLLGGDVFPIGRPESQPLPTPFNVEVAISRPVSEADTRGWGWGGSHISSSASVSFMCEHRDSFGCPVAQRLEAAAASSRTWGIGRVY